MSKVENNLLNIFVSLRPRQWLKNLVVFAAIIFSREVFIASKFIPVFYTFLILSGASSAMYIVNDLADREQDRLHFSKRKRPIASGKLSPRLSLPIAFILAASSLLASAYLSSFLFFIVLTFLIIQLLYTYLFKDIIILDILAIALAFMLRVFAGSVVVLTPLSAWLILTIMMLALFLAVGKRRSELTLLTSLTAGKHRKALLSYPANLLDGLVFVLATATLITYSLFTFNSPESAQREFFASLLPRTLASPKILMVTIPIVVYGIFRYLYLIFERSSGDSPEKILLADKPLLASAIVWLASVLFFLYFFSI